MAATKLISMHKNKGKTVLQSLKARTDYAKNGEKTDGGHFVSSYECNPDTVETDFNLSKEIYRRNTWREYEGDIIAYQIRQSFKPGEVTPEEANQIGYETVMRLTKGQHAFIVATHTDRAHIHNHIIFNSTNLECNRKFRDFWFVGIVLQKISDLVCLEHGLSVIKKRKPSEWDRRTEYPVRVTFREQIRSDIQEALSQKPEDFDAFLSLLRKKNYDIKLGKHIAVRGNGQKRYVRFRSLGENFSEENIKKVILGEKEMPEVESKTREKKKRRAEKTPFNLVIDIQEKLREGKSGGYIQWAKKYNVKQMAETLLFLNQNQIHDMETLNQLADDSSKHFHEINDLIKQKEEQIAANRVLTTHVINYARTRDTYVQYRKSGYSKKFYEEHREEIVLHQAAKEAFRSLPKDKSIKVKDLNAEFYELVSEKKTAYADYRKAKEDMKKYAVARQNVESFYRAQQTNPMDRENAKDEKSSR